ncbi:hypothetical protein BGW41_003215 [Actinomortierella wolfii]|nr:hypothetical protein BGW41_003215 [Actinomortierella wolfii]
MPKVLYRFPTGEGLVHLLNPLLFAQVAEDTTDTTACAKTSRTNNLERKSVHNDVDTALDGKGHGSLPRLEIQAVHHQTSAGFNGVTTISPSIASVIKDLARFRFHQLVCDFDETITEHDTTCSFDVLRQQIYNASESNGADGNDNGSQMNNSHHHHHSPPQPRLTWSEILDAYLTDLANVHVGDLDHLQCNRKVQHDASHQTQSDTQLEQQSYQADDREAGQDLADTCLLPWFKTQVRRRSAEEASLRRVFESGNLVGLTSAQIREYGRRQVRLRQGLVDLLLARTSLSSKELPEEVEIRGKRESEEQQEEDRPQDQGLWILSVNWSQDLIRGALDQVFGHPEVTDRVLPASRLISSNLEFSDAILRKDEEKQGNLHHLHPSSLSLSSSREALMTTGRIHARCLNGCDKLEAFRAMQAEYAAEQNLAPADTMWAYLGDSLTDLGCLVEADLGIIIGTSGSLLAECERAGIQVVDLQVVHE